MISTLVRLSRLPVGSSARISSGSLTSARAMATRCCWPPESWFGVWWRAIAEPDRVQQLERLLVPLGAPQAAAVVEQRQLDVLERGGARQQVEALEHEADLAVAELGAPVAVDAGDVLALEAVVAGASAGRAGRGCS